MISVKNADGRRLWTVLVSGILIGPTSLALWGSILLLRGADAHSLWRGDGIGLGLEQGMICALAVGFLTTAFYVIGLKSIHHPVTT